MRGRRRRLVAAVLATVSAVLAVVAFVALGGGGDGEPEAPAPTPAAASTDGAEQEAPKPKPDPDPEPLTRSELIAKADAICRESQDRYLEVRDLESEYSTDMPYAEALIRFARQRVRGLRELTPPQSVAGPYREYVEAQERVYATDKQALAAARQDDVAGIEAARAKRDSEDELRERLAREIGFKVCSTPQS